MYSEDSEYQRRERLSSKCSELASLAFKQGDIETGKKLVRNQVRLDLIQLATNRLNHPEWFEHGLSNPDKKAAEAFKITRDFVRQVDEHGGRDLIESSGLLDLL